MTGEEAVLVRKAVSDRRDGQTEHTGIHNTAGHWEPWRRLIRCFMVNQINIFMRIWLFWQDMEPKYINIYICKYDYNNYLHIWLGALHNSYE